MLHMRQLLSRILFPRVPPRNLGYSVWRVVLGCLFAWTGIANLTNVYSRVPSTHGDFLLALALLAVGLLMLVDAIVYALPDSRQLTKSRLHTAVHSLVPVGFTLLIVSWVVHFSAS